MLKRARLSFKEGKTVLQIESKIFFCDAKTNTRGLYLKISEKKANRERSTIIVPGRSLPWFRELFNYYATTDPSCVLSKPPGCLQGGVVQSICGMRSCTARAACKPATPAHGRGVCNGHCSSCMTCLRLSTHANCMHAAGYGAAASYVAGVKSA